MGIGTWNPAYGAGSGTLPQTAGHFAESLSGIRDSSGTQYIKTPTGEEPIYQAYTAADKQKVLASEIAKAATSGDFASIQRVAQQAGFSPSKVVSYALQGLDMASSGNKVPGLASTFDPNGGVAGARVTSLFGHSLTSSQQVQYNDSGIRGDVGAIQQVMALPTWAALSYNDKYATINNAIIFANKLSEQQYAQILGIKGGLAPSDSTITQALKDGITLTNSTLSTMRQSPSFKEADPAMQNTLRKERTAAAYNAVFNKYFGTLKTATNQQLGQMVDLQMQMRDQVRAYVPTLSSYQNAFNIAQQDQMTNQALTFADTLY